MTTKVYDRPDRNVSRYWRCDSNGRTIYEISRDGKKVFATCDGIGHTEYVVDSEECSGLKWLPVAVPEWPPRKKAAARLCDAEVDGERQVLAFFADDQSGVPYANKQGEWFGENELANRRWLTPEFEDELTVAL